MLNQFSHSVMSDSATPWTAAHQASLSITNSRSLLRPMSTESVMPSNHLLLCCPFLLPSAFPSIRVFSTVSSSHQVAKVLQFQLQSFQWFPLELTGLISLQSRYSQESFPIPQFESMNSLALSFLYSPALTSIHDSAKTRALTRGAFVGKVIYLLFNMLSRLVIAFLPRNKCLNFMTAITICSDFGAPPEKSDTVSTVSPSICHEVMGQDVMVFVFWMLSFKQVFSLSSFILRGSLIPLQFLP